MTIRLGIAALVNSVFINVQINMSAEYRRKVAGILFSYREIPSIHSESVPRNRSKASSHSYVEKQSRS